MVRLMQRTGERLVGLVLPKVEAGACVGGHGACCKRGYAHACLGTCTSPRSSCE